MYHFFKKQTHVRKRLWGPHLGISRKWFQKEVRSLKWTKWMFQSKDNELVWNVYFSHPFGIGWESTLPGVHCSILAPGEQRKARRKLDRQDSAGNCAEKCDMKQLSPQLYSSHCLFKPKRWGLRSFRSFFSLRGQISLFGDFWFPGCVSHPWCEAAGLWPSRVAEPHSPRLAATEFLVEKT